LHPVPPPVPPPPPVPGAAPGAIPRGEEAEAEAPSTAPSGTCTIGLNARNCSGAPPSAARRMLLALPCEEPVAVTVAA
jgi:hypothetical protein